MLIAPSRRMPVAKKLFEEIDAFLERNPEHETSVNALKAAVRRIDTEFTGETRLALLQQARTTFLQQIQILEASERTLQALQRLQKNQQNLVETLKKIAVKRPDDATLH